MLVKLLESSGNFRQLQFVCLKLHPLRRLKNELSFYRQRQLQKPRQPNEPYKKKTPSMFAATTLPIVMLIISSCSVVRFDKLIMPRLAAAVHYFA